MKVGTRALVYVVILLSMMFSALLIGLERQQILSIVVFAGIVMGALFYWRFRLAFALIGLGVLLSTGLIDVEHLVEFAGLDIIVFLLGMMIVIGFLEERHLFEALIERIMKLAGGSATKAIVLLMAMAAFSAALVDEVTSILFIASTCIHLASRLRISVVPLILMSVFATNIGSSATVVGNPVGVMIALRAGFGFSDFLRWATPMAILALVIMIPLVLYYFRGFVSDMSRKMRARITAALDDPDAALGPSYKLEWIPVLLFLGTIGGLVMHTQIELLLGLKKNSMLIGVAIIAASIALFLEKERARELVERRVDWWTLTFFLLFFSSVGTLAFTGVTTLIAELFLAIGGRDQLVMFMVTGWSIGLMSAVMDNVLAVALWIPIVAQLEAAGLHAASLWWIMLFAATMMGNLTIIGSTANIVAVGLIERQKLGHITLKQWVIPGLIVSLPAFGIVSIITYLQAPLMPA